MEQHVKNSIYACLNAIDNLVLYRGIRENPVIKKLTAYLSAALVCDGGDASAAPRSDFLAMLIDEAERAAFSGNIFRKLIVKLLLKDENRFSLALEKGRQLSPFTDTSLYGFVLRDICLCQELMAAQLPLLLQQDDLSAMVGAYRPAAQATRQDAVLLEYIENIEKAATPAAIAALLSSYYSTVGCGDIGLYTMFRYTDDKTVVPVKNSDTVTLDDLIGCETQKNDLLGNTAAFLAGLPCHNVLLCGARGTGKSSAVKALTNRYRGEGLRLLELSKDQLGDLPQVLHILGKRGKHFIILLDDLSFDEHELGYKPLKSMLEGGAGVRPANVLFYATSNRRHIIQEKWADKDGAAISGGEVHASDTVNEKLSLADRFGMTVVFPKPTPAEYLRIVQGIAQKEGVALPDERLAAEAQKWALNQRGLSGRTARQFVYGLAQESFLGRCPKP